uniref:Dynamin N-terminal domain-containing protein n=1 Tax=Sinocyclocheilus rhinocerous TaxID=307959 RepID=A0A673FSS9_9TELE
IESVQPLIELIDSLRLIGIYKDIDLPSIAVVGDQSSGKSFVLEALSGVAVPRGSGKLLKFLLFQHLVTKLDYTRSSDPVPRRPHSFPGLLQRINGRMVRGWSDMWRNSSSLPTR